MPGVYERGVQASRGVRPADVPLPRLRSPAMETALQRVEPVMTWPGRLQLLWAMVAVGRAPLS